MSRVVILGAGTALDDAWAVASELFSEAQRLPLVTCDQFNFDLAPLLSAHAPGQTRVFVAMDGRAVNDVRHQLITRVQLAGYPLVSLVAPGVTLDPAAEIAGNVYIAPGSNVGPQCSLGTGCWLGRAVMLERGVSLGTCVTLGSAVVLGEQVSVGAGATLGTGSLALAGSAVGKRCEWLLGATLPSQLADYSFYDAVLPEGSRIYRY